MYFIHSISGSFTGADSLFKIDLSGNKITALTERIFDNLLDLYTIYLYDNPINTLEAGIKQF